MERIEFLKERVSGFEKEGLLRKTSGIRRLAPSFLERARHNLVTANALYALSERDDLKLAANLDASFTAYDWVIISGYYAMYHAALSCIAQIGLKSDSHVATATAFEYYFVHRNLALEAEYPRLLGKAAELEGYYAQMIWAAKSQRETAQYHSERELGKRNSQDVLTDAARFVKRISRMHEDLLAGE